MYTVLGNTIILLIYEYFIDFYYAIGKSPNCGFEIPSSTYIVLLSIINNNKNNILEFFSRRDIYSLFDLFSFDSYIYDCPYQHAPL